MKTALTQILRLNHKKIVQYGLYVIYFNVSLPVQWLIREATVGSGVPKSCVTERRL